MLNYLQYSLLIGTVLFCLYTDLKERKIYNKVLVPAFFIGLYLKALENGLAGIGDSLLGFGLGLGFLLIPFLLGGIGGGDVKLLAVIGAIMGWKFVFFAAIGTGISGGLVAIVLLVKEKRFLRFFKEFLRGSWIFIGSHFKILSFHVDEERILFPYGVAISMGVAWTLAVLR